METIKESMRNIFYSILALIGALIGIVVGLAFAALPILLVATILRYLHIA